jgi:uncharacterized Rmd1/YagE family protein
MKQFTSVVGGMTDSEADGISRRELEHRLLKLLETVDAETGLPLEEVISSLIHYGGSASDESAALRFLRSLPMVEMVRDATQGRTMVRKLAFTRRQPDRHVKKRGTTKQPYLDTGSIFAEQGRVGYLCVADEFLLPELARHYQAEGYHTSLAFDVLHVAPKAVASDYQTTGNTGHFDMFLFDYGVVVWWSAHPRMFRIVESDFSSSASRLNKYFVNRCKPQILEENFPVWCTYSSDTRTELDSSSLEPDTVFLEKLRYDHFLIRNNSADIKLCDSHALGQSAKIDYLELEVEALTWQCKPLPRELRDRGSVTITERELLQLRGEVLFFRLMLKSGSDLLDEPELFWQHPWLKPFYTVTKEAFQVSERVETLDAKLDTANEILSMISDQFNQRHGSRLEWIVIWLVMVEVVIGVLELLVDVKPWVIGSFGVSSATDRKLITSRKQK